MLFLRHVSHPSIYRKRMRSYLSSSLTTQQNFWIHIFEGLTIPNMFIYNECFCNEISCVQVWQLKDKSKHPILIAKPGRHTPKMCFFYLKAVSMAKCLRQWSEIRHRSWKFLFQIELLFTYLEQEVLEVKDQIIKYLSLKTQKRHFNQVFTSMGSTTDCTT